MGSPVGLATTFGDGLSLIAWQLAGSGVGGEAVGEYK